MLDAAPLNGQTRLVATLTPVGDHGEVLPRQRLALDTASSSVVYCDPNLADAAKLLRTPLVACNQYRRRTPEAGFWGRVYHGAMTWQDGSLLEDHLYYSFMEQQVGMPCGDGVHGVLGLSPVQVDASYTCPDDLQLHWPPDGQGLCPISSLAGQVPPVLSMLRHRRNVTEMGIYWSGRYGRGQAALYLDAAATQNTHYPPEALLGTAQTGRHDPFAIGVDMIGFGGRAWAGFSCDTDAPKQAACYIDLASQVLSLPPAIFEHIMRSYNSGERLGPLTIRLQGVASTPTVALRFETATLLEMGWIAPNPRLGVVLGLPLWAFYYTAFDFPGRSLRFVATTVPSPWLTSAESPSQAVDGHEPKPTAALTARSKGPVGATGAPTTAVSTPNDPPTELSTRDSSQKEPGAGNATALGPVPFTVPGRARRLGRAPLLV